MTILRSLADNCDGATVIEYALIIGFIAGGVIVAINLVGTDLSALFNTMAADAVAATPSA